MGESFLDEVVRYLRFDDDAQRHLRELRPAAAPKFAAMADAFYVRILEHDQARAVINGAAQVDRLKVSMRRWFDRLLSGPWDRDYYELRARIGRMHVKVGLPQRYMLTAMNQIRDMLRDVAAEYATEAEHRRELTTAIDKVCDLELAIMLETYREDSIAAVTRVQRTEQNVLQRRLQATEARYEVIIETAEVLVIAVDKDGHVVLFNRKAEETLEISRSEVANLDVLDEFFPDQERERFRKALSSALEGNVPAPFAGRIYGKSGTERWMRWHATTLASSEEPYACAIGVDQTDEHHLEQETRRAERLATLGTLAAALAHEIRNPLNAAQLQLLVAERRMAKLDFTGTEKALEATRVVKGELSRLGVLVEDFLAFARPSSMRWTSRDLVETVNEVVALLEPDIESSGATAQIDAPSAVAATYDDERLRQVLLNLLRNALEACGTGGKVVVSVRRIRKRAVLEVRDDGPGPPGGIKLFEPFETTKVGGTGLGLSIVHRIVGDHAGHVSFERRDGWTVFRVEIPVDRPDAAVR